MRLLGRCGQMYPVEGWADVRVKQELALAMRIQAVIVL